LKDKKISLQTPDYGLQAYFLSTKTPFYGFWNIFSFAKGLKN